MANVKIYSTSACPHCIAAKEFLKENKIEYENIDVEENQEATKEMVKKSGQMGVPVIEVDGELVIGFEEDKLKKLLKIK